MQEEYTNQYTNSIPAPDRQILIACKENGVNWNKSLFNIKKKNRKKVTWNAYKFKRHHSSFPHVFYLYFTSPQFNLCIFQVKETDVYRMCII